MISNLISGVPSPATTFLRGDAVLWDAKVRKTNLVNDITILTVKIDTKTFIPDRISTVNTNSKRSHKQMTEDDEDSVTETIAPIRKSVFGAAQTAAFPLKMVTTGWVSRNDWLKSGDCSWNSDCCLLFRTILNKGMVYNNRSCSPAL